MTDISDEATRLEEKAREDALKIQQRRAGLDNKTVKDSALFCTRCDEPIPLNRRKAMPGCRLCVACQDLAERSRRAR
ncbi:TraR/DksA C4-type zinc finger protein [Undibacterium sp. TJN19]|uniref:TraR/DksA C4-type zinc finger protein n=1 Tax=Undibacterium sp. TJN19 TaxID=3413055 RepID=UPI003BF13318